MTAQQLTRKMMMMAQHPEAKPGRFHGGPSKAELEQWVREGLTDSQIATLVGQLYHCVPPTKNNVLYWRRKHNVERHYRRAKSVDHSQWIPWRVKADHAGDGIHHRLYDYSNRVQGGVPLSETADKRLDEFLALLDKYNLVVDYDPTTEDGWVMRERDPDLDKPGDIIRRPK